MHMHAHTIYIFCKLLRFLYIISYRIARFFRGGKFHEFHESIDIRENFILEIFPTASPQ